MNENGMQMVYEPDSGEHGKWTEMGWTIKGIWTYTVKMNLPMYAGRTTMDKKKVQMNMNLCTEWDYECATIICVHDGDDGDDADDGIRMQ